MPARTRTSLALMIGALASLVLVLGAPGATAASDRGQAQRDAAAEHRQQVIEFWTAEHVRNATPRELAVHPPRSAVDKPSWAGGPGGGGGGDDGDTTTTWETTGASWLDGGLVKATTGKVFFVMDGTTYVCSGSVVKDNRAEDLVLTAGHCVHDGDGATWAEKWMFVPDYDSAPASYTKDGSFCEKTRFGCWVATELTTTSRWANNADFNDDAGFAVVDGGGATSTSTRDLSETVGGEHLISFDTSDKTVPAYAFGYPHASPYDGTDLVHCAGNTIADPYGYDTRGLECDMTGGSSGGPWYLSDSSGTVFDGNGVGTAISVNSYKYTRGRYSKNMFGPVFGSAEQGAYNLANSGSGAGVKTVFTTSS